MQLYKSLKSFSSICISAMGILILLMPWSGAFGQTPISTWHELDDIRNNLSGDYILINDLGPGTAGYDDLAGPAANGGSGWVPIPDFTGELDGGGFEIHNLVINGNADRAGLFAFNSGTLHNFLLVDPDVNGAGSFATTHGVGAVAGVNTEDGNIFRVGVTTSDPSDTSVRVSGSNASVGGITGSNDDGSIIQSYVTVSVSGGSLVGGLAGYISDDSIIEDSYSLGNITGASNIGGIAGSSNGSVERLYVAAEVSGTGGGIGPFRGNDHFAGAQPSVNSFWNTDIGPAAGSRDANDTGLTGITTPEMQTLATFLDANWDFIGFGGDEVWGFNHADNNGFPFLAWQQNFTHSLRSDSELTDLSAETGAMLIGTFDPAQYAYTFIFTEEEGEISFELPGGATSNMSSPITFDVNDGEDTVELVVTAEDQTKQTTYEITASLFADGDGTEVSPWVIEDWYQLNNVRYERSGNFILANDLKTSTPGYTDLVADLAGDPVGGSGWEPIGDTNNRFTGTLDGDGFTIDELIIYLPADPAGLFEFTQNAVIQDLNMTNAKMRGNLRSGTIVGRALSSSFIRVSAEIDHDIEAGGGGLVGYLEDNSEIMDSYTTGAMEGRGGIVGGLVAIMINSTIRRSFSSVSILSQQQSGGIVGVMEDSEIYDTYTTGNVTLISNPFPSLGGFVGVTRGDNLIQNVYSAGAHSDDDVGGFARRTEDNTDVISAFWNTTVQGAGGSDTGVIQNTSSGNVDVTGITTEEMQNVFTFYEAGWDFLGENANGTDDIWKWNPAENNGYPFLIWQQGTNIIPPVVAALTPESDADRVAVDTDIQVQFTQDISLEDAGKIELTDEHSNTLNITSHTEDESLIITPDDGDLDHATIYTVTIASGAVENSDNISNNDIEWSFTTFPSAPFAENESPGNGSDGVTLDADVTVDFNQDVTEINLNGIEIRDAANELVDNVSATLNNNTITITHDDFDHFTEYTVTIPAGAVENDDDVGNELYEWNFTTIMAAPLAENESPGDGSDGVTLDADVAVDFNQDVTEVDLDDIEIRDTDNNLVDNIHATLDNNTITITHDGFEFFTEYTVTIPAGAVENDDGVGNETFNWSFTTIMVSPVAENESPENGQKGVALDIGITVNFNQNVTAENLSGVKIRNADGEAVANVVATLDNNQLTISHADFEHFTVYTVTIPAGTVKNNDGIENTEYSWSFTTTLSAPVVSEVSPANNTGEIAVNTELSIAFNQDVTEVDLSGISITDDQDNPVSGLAAVFEDNEITITHNGFAWLTTYTAKIPAGVVENADNVKNDGYNWEFTTIIKRPAAAALSSPADGATDLGLTPELIWDEAGRAENYSLQLSDNGDFTDPLIDIKGLEAISYQVESNLDQEQTYYWRVQAQNSGGLSDWSDVYTFTTLPAPPAQVILTAPRDSAGAVPLHPEFSWEEADRTNTYQIEVAKDEGFGETVFAADDLDDLSYSPVEELAYYNMYYWRVRAENSGGLGDWSEPGIFITKAEAPDPQFPVADGFGISIAPLFSWVSSYGDSSFEMRLGTDAQMSDYQEFEADATILQVFGLDGNTDYYWQVRLTDELTQSQWSEPSPFSTRINPAPQEVSLRYSFDRIESTKIASEDYLVIGLPGREERGLDEFFDGDYKDDWRAFADLGSEHDFLSEYDPESNRLQFGPGLGYWVFHRDSVEMELTIEPVVIDEQDSYAIDIHPGWNLIANPFVVSVGWDDVLDFNDIEEGSLFEYKLLYSESDSLRAFTGYYFYNDPQWKLNELRIPYGNPESRRSADGNKAMMLSSQAQPIETGRIGLAARFGDGKDRELAATEVSWEYEPGYRGSRYPSLEMSRYGVVFTSGEIDQTQRMGAHYDETGTEYELTVKAPVGQTLRWEADFSGMSDQARVLLVNPVTFQSQMLHDGETAEVKVSEPEITYEVYVGDEAYLQEMHDNLMPEEITLKQNYPNPFNPTTIIRYALVDQGHVSLEVYDLLGRRVQTLVNEQLTPGWYTVEFNGSSLASGVYLYRLVAGQQIKTGRMMLVK